MLSLELNNIQTIYMQAFFGCFVLCVFRLIVQGNLFYHNFLLAELKEEIEVQPCQRMTLRSKSFSENEVCDLPSPSPPVVANHYKLKHLLTQTVSVGEYLVSTLLSCFTTLFICSLQLLAVWRTWKNCTQCL